MPKPSRFCSEKNFSSWRRQASCSKYQGARRRAPRAACTAGGPAVFVGVQHFRRVQSRQFGSEQLVALHFLDEEAARRQVRPGQAVAHAAGARQARDRQQQRVAAFFQQGFVGDRARRDHAHHLAFHQSLGGRRVADLFADRHRLAQRDQASQVGLDRVHRHARHRDRLAGRGAALGQGDVEQARGAARVLVEELIEIPHPEEQQDVRVLCLRRVVLAHERRVLRRAPGVGGGGFGGGGH
jgi:hypothetical protein